MLLLLGLIVRARNFFGKINRQPSCCFSLPKAASVVALQPVSIDLSFLYIRPLGCTTLPHYSSLVGISTSTPSLAYAPTGLSCFASILFKLKRFEKSHGNCPRKFKRESIRLLNTIPIAISLFIRILGPNYAITHLRIGSKF